MTILEQGAALFFTREELAAAHLIPEDLTPDEALALIRKVFRQANIPMLPYPEVRCFPDPHGVLLFLHSRTEDIPHNCCFSVTFS